MTLPPLVLDDLSWESMVEAIRRRIPAESDGAWTLHSPVDPGITLLELFAYLLEQRLYWLDQVPDELVLAVARLLGSSGPRPARAAGTVLRLKADRTGGTAPRVPDGTVFARDAEQQIAFTVQGATTVLPIDSQRLWAGGRELTGDVAAGRPVALFIPDGGPGEVRIVLNVDAQIRPDAGSSLSLLLELDVPEACPAAWLPDAFVGVPPPAELIWSWYLPDPDDAATGEQVAIADVTQVDDGTAGLRRSGVVRVPLPAEWCDGAAGTRPSTYGLRLSTAATTFAVSPVLLQLTPNAAPATHRRRLAVTGDVVADQLRAWRRLPGQHLNLPAARGALLSAEVSIVRDGVAQEWTAADQFTFAGPADRAFLADRDAGAIRFGDGLTGAIPVPDALGSSLNVEVAYDVGGGVTGNGGRTANWTLVREGSPVSNDLIVTAENVVPAEDGAEAETIAQIRARIGDEQAEVTRAVTAADVVELATQTDGVAIARCYVGPGEHPNYPCSSVPGAVTVRIVPGVRDPAARLTDAAYDARLRPDPGALLAVAARLEGARLLGTEIFVRPPRYRLVALRVELSGAPSDVSAVRGVVQAALRRFLDPLVGGDAGTGWPFGEPLRPSALLRSTQDALGDLAQVERVAIGLDGAEPTGGCFDVPLGTGWLPALTSARVGLVAATAGQGLS